MNAFLALVAREISERKALLAAAAVASLLPLLAPMLPGTGTNSASDIREAVMWVMVLGLIPLFALLLGVSFIGRDLSEGRLGFYYAQPLSGTTIWFGKLTAMVGLVSVTHLIIMVPTVILSPDPIPVLTADALLDSDAEAWVFWSAAPFLILLVHAVGIVWRSRSLWLIVDFVALLLIAWGAWTAFSSIGIMVAPTISERIVSAMLVALLGGLLIGGAVQTVTGRVDLRRCHAALTVTVWSVLGVTTAALLGWTWWIRSATIEDLDRFHHATLGSGEWVAITGVSDGRLDYHPRVLVNLVDGRNLLIGPAVSWRYREIELSEDGRRAVWAKFEGFDDWRMMTTDLEEDEPQERFTGVSLGIGWEDLSVSPEGTRCAVLEDRTLSVYDIETGRQLVAATVDGAFDPYAIRFADEGTVQFIASTRSVDNQGDRTQGIGNLNVETRTLGDIVEIDTYWRWWHHNLRKPTGNKLVRKGKSDSERLVLVDPETGDTIADLGAVPRWPDVRIIPDGRIVVLRDQTIQQDQDSENRLEVFTPDGLLIHRIEIPIIGGMTDGGLVSPDRLMIGVRDWRDGRLKGGPEYSTAVVNLKTGRVEEILEGVAPILGRYASVSSAGAWAFDSFAGRLFLGEGFSLLLWDPADGSFETVIPVPD